MATPADQLALYGQWHKFADADGDGVVSGGEAVSFFQRSGLDQTALGQIWELASGGAPSLNKPQFYNAMRLVSLAQTSGGRLPLEQARVVLAGLGPALPVPRMRGMQQFGGPSYSPQPTGGSVGYTGQTTGGSGYVSQPTGYAPQPTGYQGQAAFQAAGYAPQYTGAVPSQAQQPSYAPQFTGAGYMPQATGSGAGGLAPATQEDIERYKRAFVELDTDRDGLVQGAQCFTYFQQWRLDKAVLRHIWDIVAGTSGTLNQPQFISCLYLMDAAAKGIRPPPILPPGPFPPVAQGWSLASQFGGASAAGPRAPSQQAATVPVMPTLPTKFNEPQQQPASEVAGRPSQVPTPGMSNFNAEQKSKLETELEAAREREAKLHAAEAEAARTRERLAAFNAAMQEVAVFKSRTDVALLQAQDQASRLESELEAAKKKYDSAYAAAQAQGDSAAKLRDHLSSLLSSKAEAELKLSQLEAEIAAANAVTPADVARMEAELSALTQRVTEATGVRDARAAQLKAIKDQRVALEGQLQELKKAQAEAEAETEDVRKEVAGLQAEAAALRAGTGADSAVTVLPGLLSKAARVYRSLYASVLKAGAQPPPEVLPSALGLATWMDDALAGAADWNDLDDVARGYVIVNALPMHARAPPKAAAAQNGFADGFGDSAFGAPAAPAFGGHAAAAPAASVPSVAPQAPAAPAVTAAAPAPPAAVHVAEAAARVFSEAPAFGASAAGPAAAKTGGSPGPASAGVTGAGGGGGFEEDNAFGVPAFGAAPAAAPAQAAQPQQAAPPAATVPPAATGFGFEDSAFS